MTHFAYPNVKESQFIGCGRYIALPGLQPGYQIAQPKIARPSKVKTAASILAPESRDAVTPICEKKDRPENFQGDSQDLAYLLALISRTRALRQEATGGDIWCTGSLDLVDGKNPFLDAVYEAPFELKLDAFIAPGNPDRLFIVPDSNIQPHHHLLLEQHAVNILSVSQNQTLPPERLARGKTVLKVSGHELAALVDTLFTPCETGSRHVRRASLRERLRRQRATIIGSAVGLLLTGLVALLVGMLWRHANEQQALAKLKTLEALSVSAKALLLSHDELGAMFALVKTGKLSQEVTVPAGLQRLMSASFQEILQHVHEKNRLADHAAAVTSVAFHPTQALLASGDANGTILLRDAHGVRVKRALREKSGLVLSLAFHPKNAWLASGTSEQGLTLWNTDTGEPRMILKGHTGAVFSVAFRPDGAQLASAGEDGQIILWNPDDGSVLHTLSGHGAAVNGLAFSPDGTQLASGSDDQTIIVWNLADGSIRTTLQGHHDSVQSLAFAPREPLLAAGTLDGTVSFWDWEQGRERVTLPAHTGGVARVEFSPNGQLLASASHDTTIKLWSVQDQMLVTTLQGHAKEVYALNFRPDGQALASGSWDQTVRLWQLQKEPVTASSLRAYTILGCYWLEDFLQTNPRVSAEDRAICADLQQNSTACSE